MQKEAPLVLTRESLKIAYDSLYHLVKSERIYMLLPKEA